ncbi:hypothetical protein OG562_14855 [Streptomyces sp. NBC_01275]|uniref:hypothetical protein n=1 Tax=Streptomyces sp. NBC_01275 TaxID=2903807 RepID=UPI00225A2582|nr:hypothetical protein [Streptomyces sp. NBC_01275]MCX4762232.1 hypothetical protein [Streptomyces sp. NBC_01275]
MERDLARVWWVGLALSALVLGALGPMTGYDGNFLSVVMLACLTAIAGVVPTHALVFRWLGKRDRRVPGWIAYLAAAVVSSVALSLLTSLILIGLPHAWETAVSWSDIRLRTTWIAGVLVPAAVGTHLVIRLWRRLESRTYGGDRPRSSGRGGEHR